MERQDQDELLARARRREPAALDQLVSGYAHRIFGLLVRLTSSRDVAEELMQETFLRMVRTIDLYEHDGRFEPWLFRIAANLARDHVRRRRRRGRTLSLDATAHDPDLEREDLLDSALPPPEAGLEREEQRRRLGEGLKRLNPAEREILALRHDAELSFKEISELLRIPMGTALARAHRALQRLRDSIEGGKPT